MYANYHGNFSASFVQKKTLSKTPCTARTEGFSGGFFEGVPHGVPRLQELGPKIYIDCEHDDADGDDVCGRTKNTAIIYHSFSFPSFHNLSNQFLAPGGLSADSVHVSVLGPPEPEKLQIV